MEEHFMKSGSADIFFIKENDKIIRVRKQYFRKPQEKIMRETHALTKLKQNNCFPKIISIDAKNNSFIMNYCGSALKQNNLPPNWSEQIKYIIDAMEAQDIVNGDIDLKNLTVDNGTITLLDFGNIRMKGEEFFETHDYEIYKTKQHHKLFIICNALAKSHNASTVLKKYNRELTAFYSKR